MPSALADLIRASFKNKIAMPFGIATIISKIIENGKYYYGNTLSLVFKLQIVDADHIPILDAHFL